MNEVSTSLRHIRESFGFTAEEMAKICDIARPTYSNYETGRNEPPVAVLKAISTKTGISIDEITDAAFCGKNSSAMILQRFARHTLLP